MNATRNECADQRSPTTLYAVDPGLPVVMHEHVGYLLVRLGKRAQRAFEEAVAPLGLRPPHFDLLAVLGEQGAVSQKDVATILDVDSARVVAWADELADLGALERTPDPADRRRNLLTLTAEGRRLLRRAQRAAAKVEADLTAALDADGRAALRSLLQRVL